MVGAVALPIAFVPKISGCFHGRTDYFFRVSSPPACPCVKDSLAEGVNWNSSRLVNSAKLLLAVPVYGLSAKLFGKLERQLTGGTASRQCYVLLLR